MLVADRDNKKVRLFSSSLNYLGDVTLAGHELSEPYRLHFDQLISRLYISQGEAAKTKHIIISILDNRFHCLTNITL